MRDVNLLVVFLACLFLTLSFLLPGRSLRDWRQKAISVSGVLGMFYVGWSLYGIRYVEKELSDCTAAFFVTKGLLAGAATGILASLWMEGELNLFKAFRKSERGTTSIEEQTGGEDRVAKNLETRGRP